MENGAVLEMTGSAPKITFGPPSAPVCEISLDRRAEPPRLQSTCAIHMEAAGQRQLMASDMVGPAQAESVSMAEHLELKKEVARLRQLAEQLIKESKRKSNQIA